MGPGKSHTNYPPPRIYGGTSTPTPPLEIGPENRSNYPPSNLRNINAYPLARNRPGKSLQLPPPRPPLEIGPENRSNYPPSNLRNSSSTTPPLEIEPPFSKPWLRPCCGSISNERPYKYSILLLLLLLIHKCVLIPLSHSVVFMLGFIDWWDGMKFHSISSAVTHDIGVLLQGKANKSSSVQSTSQQQSTSHLSIFKSHVQNRGPTK